jgi:hypothetical protein
MSALDQPHHFDGVRVTPIYANQQTLPVHRGLWHPPAEQAVRGLRSQSPKEDRQLGRFPFRHKAR